MDIGTITGFGQLAFGSGLAVIYINNVPIFIESGFGLRTIAQAFGSLEKAIGKEIEYTVSWNNVLEGFTPADEGVEI